MSIERILYVFLVYHLTTTPLSLFFSKILVGRSKKCKCEDEQNEYPLNTVTTKTKMPLKQGNINYFLRKIVKAKSTLKSDKESVKK